MIKIIVIAFVALLTNPSSIKCICTVNKKNLSYLVTLWWTINSWRWRPREAEKAQLYKKASPCWYFLVLPCTLTVFIFVLLLGV